MKITLLLIMILGLTSIASAQDIRIACVIPEMPGVNSPILSENTYRDITVQSKIDNISLQKESLEKRTITGTTQDVSITTIYPK
jgi:hypothetical protein